MTFDRIWYGSSTIAAAAAFIACLVKDWLVFASVFALLTASQYWLYSRETNRVKSL